MVIIYASNVHGGGGKVLLEALLTSLKKPAMLFADTRLRSKFSSESNLILVPVVPSVSNRLLAEFKLKKASRRATKILCFGNLPPLFRLSAPVDLYFQNTILLGGFSGFQFSIKTKFKHQVERLWLSWGLRFIQTVYVQSEVVKTSFSRKFPKARVVVAPFIGELKPLPNVKVPSEFDFIYVASQDPHKNHERLLDAFELLIQNNLFPRLALTIPQTSSLLLDRIDVLTSKGAKITNIPSPSHEDVMELYAKSSALIFPSLTESFGLPLLEAQAFGLPILASELDYVREVVTPVETFDPFSSKSIARAIARYLGDNAFPNQKILTASEFLSVLEA